MKLKVKISPSTTQSQSVEVSIDKLGYTKEQWDSMTIEKQLIEIDDYISSLDQPYWEIDSVYTIDDDNQQ